ncbi:MAG: type I-E CRISPR-associated protein Cas7/Cse4/CasC [Eubacteriales bacterium]
MSKRLFMDIHVLQTIPPSCVNRDDTGSPKTAIYGGVTRARVSSQAWKKAIRDLFRSNTVGEQFEMGIRTKSLLDLVADRIVVKKPGTDIEEAYVLAMKTINIAGKDIIKSKSKNNGDNDEEIEVSGNEALFFITPKQVESVADLAVLWASNNIKPSKKDVVNALNVNKGIDEALFGRMVAQAPTLNTEACAQVAHSISTHKVITEYDYFTAVDDLKSEEHAGSAHIGINEFYSATIYRYATVAIHELYGHLKDKSAEAAKGFLDAFVLSMPSGKQNTYANNNIPYTVFVTLREDRPVNLSGAFEKPVNPGNNGSDGYERASLIALEKHVQEVHDNWLGDPEYKFFCGQGSETFGEKLNFAELKNEVYRHINDFVSGGELV